MNGLINGLPRRRQVQFFRPPCEAGSRETGFIEEDIYSSRLLKDHRIRIRTKRLRLRWSRATILYGNVLYSRLMIRLFISVLFIFSAVCLLTSAPTLAQSSTLRIGGGAVTWDDATKTVTINRVRAGVWRSFAKIQFTEGHTASAVVPAGSTRSTIPGDALIVRETKSNAETLFVVPPQYASFVLIRRNLNESMFAEGPIKKLEFPSIGLLTPADDLVTLGTAGLQAVDKHRGSYMFLAAAHPKDRSGVVTGWVTSRQGSGIVFSEKNADGLPVIKPVIEYGKLLPPDNYRSPNGTVTEDFVIGWFDDCRLGLEQYARHVATAHMVQIKTPPAGYCTWYADAGKGGACNEKDILLLADAAAEKLAPFGFNFVQIDDKWQDGISNNGPRRNFLQVAPRGPYPNGMKAPAEHIRAKGMRAGIWLLPFAGSPEDPTWDQSLFAKSGITEAKNTRFSFRGNLLHKEGEPYRTRWTGATLDMTNPAAQERLRKTIEQMAKDWQFNYFKLDGFNAALGVENIYDTRNGEYRADDLGEPVYFNPAITPVAAHRIGLETVRKAAGSDAFILGCNVSQNMRAMGASYGLVDAMRIGPDNGAAWGSLKRGPWHGSNRYFYNGRVWWNDPDPVYVKDSMPLEHARLIATWVAVSGQLYVFSDWLPNLSEERLNILRRTMRPHGLISTRPVDLFNEDLPKIWYLTNAQSRRLESSRRDDMVLFRPEQHIVAFYNWDDKNATKIETSARWIGLPEAEEYAAFDYWGDKFFGSFRDELSVEVPAGSCLVLAVQPVKTHPILLSTSQHVTQGVVDVVSVTWNAETKTLSGVSKVIANDPYELRIYDPATKEIRRVMSQPTETNDAFKWSVEF